MFSILFRGSTASSGGLLRAVEQRYAGNDQTSTFNEVVGDGTLWMVLVATLGKSRWEGIGAFIDKAIALREVFTSPQLLGSAQAHRVAGLLGKIRIEDAQRYLAEVAPTVTRLLGQLKMHSGQCRRGRLALKSAGGCRTRSAICSGEKPSVGLFAWWNSEATVGKASRSGCEGVRSQ